MRPAATLRFPAILRALLLVAIAFLFEATALARPQLGPGHEAEVKALIVGEGGPELGEGFTIAGIAIEPTGIRVRVDGPSPGALILDLSGDPAPTALLRSASFAFLWSGPSPPPGPVVALATKIAARDQGGMPDKLTATEGQRSLETAFGAIPFPRPLWILLAALNIALFLGAPLAAPRLCPVEPLSPSGRPPPRAFPLQVALFAAVALVAALFAARAVGSQLTFTPEIERYFAIARVCASGKVCPLVGQPLTFFEVRLGPLFYDVLALTESLRPGPVFATQVVFTLHGLAAGLVALLAGRLFGLRWGALAGLLFGLSTALLPVYAYPQHAGFAPLPLAGFTWALVSWMQTRRPASLVVAVTCLSAAVQMHGIAAMLGASALPLVLVSPPRPPRRALLAAAAIVALQWLPWFIYYARVPFSGLDWNNPGWRSDRPLPFLAWLASLGFAPIAAVLLAALALGFLSLDRSRPAPARHVAQAFASTALAALLVVLLGRRHFRPQYAVAFLPLLPLAAVALGNEAWQRLRASPRLPLVHRALAVLAGLAAVELAWLTVAPLRLPLVDDGNLEYAEQARIVARLAQLGFGPRAMERRVHGLPWDRSRLGIGYLAATTARSAPIDERMHALLALRGDGPRPAPPLLYPTRLDPVLATLTPAGGATTSLPAALPFVDVSVADFSRAVLFELDPSLGTPPARGDFLDALRAPRPLHLRLTTTFHRPIEDRALVVVHNVSLPIGVYIGEREARPVAAESAGALEHARFRLDGDGDLPITIDLDGTGGDLFDGLDVYDAPAPP